MGSEKVAFITGISGQDGSYLAELLLSRNYTVHGLIRRESNYELKNIDNIKDLLILHWGDIETENHLCYLINDIRPTEIYHLAAQSDVSVSFDTPESTGNSTGLGTVRLLEAVRRFSPYSHMYQASTAEMLGGSQPPQTEQTPMRARSPYAAAKIYAHEMCRVYREAYGLHISCGVLGNHESERRGAMFVTRKITEAVARIKLGKQDILELGNLSSEKDWGYAPEYVDAMWRMLQQVTPDDYIVATGETHTVKEFAVAAFEHVGLDWAEHVTVNPKFLRPSDTFTFRPDISKAQRVLRWRPTITFKELVRKMVDNDLKLESKNAERTTSSWVECPSCGKLGAYLMSDSHNLWCIECKRIVS